MQIGLLMVFQNFEDGITDQEAWERDIHLGGLAEPLGFDTLSAVEHHFFNYAMSPDNLQYLSYMASQTEKIGLLTGAVILPWNDPLRVVERMIVLDHLSQGQGSVRHWPGPRARREYEHLRRGHERGAGSLRRVRGDDHSSALETGVIEGNGPYYKQRAHGRCVRARTPASRTASMRSACRRTRCPWWPGSAPR